MNLWIICGVKRIIKINLVKLSLGKTLNLSLLLVLRQVPYMVASCDCV